MKSLVVSLFVLCLAGAARADSTARDGARAPLTLTLQGTPAAGPDQGFRDVLVGGRRSVGSVILYDALYGGLIGVAIGAGVALINNDFNNGNWGRDLAIGGGVGLIAGGVFGAVDVLAYSDRYLAETNRGQRDRGFGRVAGMRAAF